MYKYLKPVIAVVLLFALGCTSAEEAKSSKPQDLTVLFDRFVYLQDTRSECSRAQTYVAVTVHNSGRNAVQFDGYKTNDRWFLRLGMEGRVEYFEPGARDWNVGLTEGHDFPNGKLVVPARSQMTVYVPWSISYFVDFPTETLFKITLVDSIGNKYPTEAFPLHDGRQKLVNEIWWPKHD